MPLTKHRHMTLCNHADCDHAPRAWLPWLRKAWGFMLQRNPPSLDAKELSPVHVEAKKKKQSSMNKMRDRRSSYC